MGEILRMWWWAVWQLYTIAWLIVFPFVAYKFMMWATGPRGPRLRRRRR